MLLVLLSVQGQLARFLVKSTTSSAAWANWPNFLPYSTGDWQRIQGTYFPSKYWPPGISPWNCLQKPVPVLYLTQPGKVPHLLAETCYDLAETLVPKLQLFSFHSSPLEGYLEPLYHSWCIQWCIQHPLLRVWIPSWPFLLIQTQLDATAQFNISNTGLIKRDRVFSP